MNITTATETRVAGIRAALAQFTGTSIWYRHPLFRGFLTTEGVQYLANNAAAHWLVDTSPELFDQHMDTNVKGPFFLMQDVARHLLDTGKPGSIVNILSTAAFVGQSFLAGYSTSKGALMTLTKNTANAYRANLIRCNAVAPGWMDTPGEDVVQKKFHDAEDDWLDKAEASVPMGQLVKPAQMAPLITYLLSPDSGIITGAVINYDQQIIGAVPEAIGLGD